MHKFFLFFLISFCCSSINAATSIAPGFVPSITMGGVTMPIGQSIILTASNNTTNYYDTLKKNGTGYQVPAGYKLVIVAIRVANASAVATTAVLGYGDTSVSNASGAPTNSVQFNIGSGYPVTGYTTAALGSFFESSLSLLEVPAGKYPYLQSVNGVTIVQILGYLLKV